MIHYVSLMVILSALLLGGLFAPLQADFNLKPSDDSWIDLNNPESNFNQTGLMVYYSNQPCKNVWLTYLRFDLSSIEQDFGDSPRLRLYQTTAPKIAGELSLWSTNDDWNGSLPGNGGENTLTYANAPEPVARLDIQKTGTTGSWVEFSGVGLSAFLNSQRTANGGDNQASFVIQFENCSGEIFDYIRFEDREGSVGTGNFPELESSGFVVQPTGRPTENPFDKSTGTAASVPTVQLTGLPTNQSTGLPTDLPTNLPGTQSTETLTADTTTQPTGLLTKQPTELTISDLTAQPGGLATQLKAANPSASAPGAAVSFATLRLAGIVVLSGLLVAVILVGCVTIFRRSRHLN